MTLYILTILVKMILVTFFRPIYKISTPGKYFYRISLLINLLTILFY